MKEDFNFPEYYRIEKAMAVSYSKMFLEGIETNKIMTGDFILDESIDKYLDIITKFQKTRNTKTKLLDNQLIDLDKREQSIYDFKRVYQSLLRVYFGYSNIFSLYPHYKHPHYVKYLLPKIPNELHHEVLEIKRYLSIILDPLNRKFSKKEAVETFQFPSEDYYAVRAMEDSYNNI